MDKFGSCPIFTVRSNMITDTKMENKNGNDDDIAFGAKANDCVLSMHTTFVVSDESETSKVRECKRIPNTICKLIEREFEKDFDSLNWKANCITECNISKDKIMKQAKKDRNTGLESMGHDSNENASVTAAKWVHSLIVQFPIQVARGNYQKFSIMHDGATNNTLYGSCATVDQLSQLIRFGCYDSVINDWKGKIFVVSSMGKQSTGKSYLLNHMFGTKFDISGMRCTDGSWMSVRIINNIMFIIFDFEGLGSPERTIEEDTFLAIFNSAISNCTLFKSNNNFDKDVISMFKKFQSGIKFIEAKNRNIGDNGNESLLFQGTLYICVKDIQQGAEKEVGDEFRHKIKQFIDDGGQNSFVLNMVCTWHYNYFTLIIRSLCVGLFVLNL